ncbi:MAG: DNA gyrase C-terminal beta-propeller domain-containing protein, partial [Candidatus Omnitrophota bacterium]
LIKKTRLSAFSNPRKAGIVGITLDKDDLLIETSLTDGKQQILLATKEGKSVQFKEEQVRDMGRQAKGVRGMRLSKKDEVIGMEVVPPESKKLGLYLLTVTSGGFAKRTDFDEYRLQSRGGKGIINIKVTSKIGTVVGMASVTEEDEVMTVTKQAMMVRCAVKDIRKTGRNTQGVRLISLEKDDAVASLAKVVAKEE